MILIEKDGYDFMLIGAKEEEIDKFWNDLLDTPFGGVVGINTFNVPKGDKKIPVYIVSAGTNSSREYCMGYWEKKGHAIVSTEEVSI